MARFLRLCLCLSCLLGLPRLLAAQVDDSADQREYYSRQQREREERERRQREENEELERQAAQEREARQQDTAVAKRQLPFRVRPGEKFDLVFHRTLLLTGGMSDSVPATVLSGSVYLGTSFNFVFNRKWTAKAGLGVNFFRLVFDNGDPGTKRFPSLGDSLSSEKIRVFYAEVPLGIAYTFQRDERNRLVGYAEVGATLGYAFYNDYKLKQSDVLGRDLTAKFAGLDHINKWRYGVYAQVVYKFVGLWAYYRLSDVFSDDGRYDPALGVLGTRSGDTRTARYPEVAPFELGITFVL